MILPRRFKERMAALLGEAEAAKLFSAITHGEAVRAFRINSIKTDIDRFEASHPKIDRKKADFPSDAYITNEEFPGSLPCHHSGAIYMQDISAMSTVNALELAKGMSVLDSCSAPGGKTSQIAAAVGECGIVVANEYEKKRCRILQSNIERMGAKNTVICNLDTAVLAKVYPDRFDLVLCDAPCSGEGMFRKNPRAVDEWSEENVKMCAERQREILANVAKCVKAGGKLLYSTCTFSVEENEENVKWFLDAHSEYRLTKVNRLLINQSCDGISPDGCEYDMSLCRRIYPHRSLGEGQFIALFERREDAETRDDVARDAETLKNKGKNKRQRELGGMKQSSAERELVCMAQAFLDENLDLDEKIESCYELKVIGGFAYLSPKIQLPEYNVVASGVSVGEAVNGRFVPHHQLFSAYGNRFKLRICLSGDGEETKKYLRGEEISVEGFCACTDGRNSGYAAVIIDGCAVGGAKVSGHVAKNHYPKGLRNDR